MQTRTINRVAWKNGSKKWEGRREDREGGSKEGCREIEPSTYLKT